MTERAPMLPLAAASPDLASWLRCDGCGHPKNVLVVTVAGRFCSTCRRTVV